LDFADSVAVATATLTLPEVLSRFRSAKEQKQVLARLKRQDVDILIGMHRLAHYPLLVTIGMETESVLVNWREQAKALIIAAGFAAFVIACAVFVLALDAWKFRAQDQGRPD
jgi:cytochrome c-type biogenesis protein CcmH/NrfG